MVDRAVLKQRAKLSMRGKKPSVYVVAIVFLVINYILAELMYKLLNADAILSKIYDYLDRSAANLDLSGIASLLPKALPVAIILSLVIAIMSQVISVGFMSYCLKTSRGEDGSYKNLFDGFIQFWKIVLTSILMGIFVALWSLLFIVPGIIAVYRYSQAYYILLDNPDMSALACIRESKRIMKGRKGTLFVLDLSFIGWSFLASFIQICLGLLIPVLSSISPLPIFLQPYIIVTRSMFYNELIGHPAKDKFDAPPLNP